MKNNAAGAIHPSTSSGSRATSRDEVSLSKQTKTAGGSTLLTTGIPEGWEVKKLLKVTEKIGSGATPRGGKESYQTSGISLIRSQNVLNHRFSYDGLAFINDLQAKDLENVEVMLKDVLLNITGDSVARCCLVPDNVLPARVNQHVAIIRTKKTQLDSHFLHYFLVSSTMQQSMLSMAGSGGTRQALTKGMIENFEIPIPEISEQRAIAKILSGLDEKIELNHRMNKTLESIAQALFKHWFVDVVENEFPNGWQSGVLGEVAENARDGVQPDDIEPLTPYIGLEHMPRQSVALSAWSYSSELESNKFKFKRGQILFGKLRPYFHKVGIAPIDGICSTDILVIEPKEPEWFGFVLGHVSSADFVNYTTAASTGTKMPRTNWQDMENYKIALPPKSLAMAFNNQIRFLVEKIINNIHESKILAAIRDSLLPRLMSGKIRVGAIHELPPSSRIKL